MPLSVNPADISVCGGADSFLQSAMWGRFKARFGWTSRAFLVEWEGLGKTALLLMSRRLAPGLSFAYAPWGPELPPVFPACDEQRCAALAELARRLSPLLPGDTAFIRFDPPWFNTETGGQTGSLAPSLKAPFCRAAADIQPPDTVLVDLRPSQQEILAAMKSKWRYNIGLAEKRGVKVGRRDEQGLAVFYRLLAETAARDGIAMHSMEYYQSLFAECRGGSGGVPSELRLYTAEHEGDALAAIVVLCRGKTATYLYGASSNAKRNLMAPYALQWQAMQDAKESGCVLYDMFGIPPSADPNHPMAGLYLFKTGFGGSVIHRSGSWDYPCRPLLYAMFSAAEGIRKKLRDIRKKRRK